MRQDRLRQIRTAALSGRLPEGLTQQDVEEYSQDVVADYDLLVKAYPHTEALRRMRHELLALRRADGGIPVDRARVLIRQAEDEGLI